MKIKNLKFLPLCLLVLILIALIFRIILTPYGFHDDILSNAGWGEWIYYNGHKGFYSNNIWIYSYPTQPPLISALYGFNYYIFKQLTWVFTYTGLKIATFHLAPSHMLWYFDFVKWFGEKLYAETAFIMGFLISMKLIAILSDMAIGTIIYFLARSYNKGRAIIFPLLFLFSPFSWYISSLWGQYDQTSYLFLILSFIALVKKNLWLGPILLLISVGLKPTSLILMPLFAWFYIKQKPNLYEFIIALFLGFGIFIHFILLFADKPLILFIKEELIPKIFFKTDFRLTTNAFNFWRILTGDKAFSQDFPFLLIPAKYWGYAIFILFNLIAVKISRTINFENIFKGVFLVSAGSWLFLTNMLDRYFFIGLATLLIICIYNKTLTKYWIILSIIFWLNLFNKWWFPQIFSPLKQVLIWQDFLITKILSLVNVAIFIRILFLFKPPLNILKYKSEKN